jgi:hypothetical protein
VRFGMGELGLGQTFATTVANSDGSTTPVDTTVNNSSDLSNILAGGAGGSTVCPCSSCTIVPGACDTTIYLAIAAVAVMFGLAVAK